MNLREKMGRTFQNFWNINLGHVCIASIFLFGLGINWQRMTAKVESVDAARANDHSIAMTALSNAVSERNLKLESLTARIERDETEVHAVADLRTQVAVIAVQMTNITGQLQGLRSDLKERNGNIAHKPE